MRCFQISSAKVSIQGFAFQRRTASLSSEGHCVICMSSSENVQLNLLVVEDHRYSRELLCDMLRILGYVAQCVETAEDAVALLASQRFDVLLADINLPGMSGIDLAHVAVKAVPDIGIVFVSGFGYLVADKTDFPFILVPKPFNLARLKDAVTQACAQVKSMDSVVPPK